MRSKARFRPKNAGMTRHIRVSRPPSRGKNFSCPIEGSTSHVSKPRRRLAAPALRLSPFTLRSPQLERKGFVYQKLCAGILSTSSGDTLGIALCMPEAGTAPTPATIPCIKFKPKFHRHTNTLGDISPSGPDDLHAKACPLRARRHDVYWIRNHHPAPTAILDHPAFSQPSVPAQTAYR